MTELAIKRLTSGGVITNYHCVSRCGHCLYNCSPERGKGYLDAEWAERIFKRITDLGCRSVHIGGGEPMLHPAKLVDVAATASSAGLGIDYVETNSAWFTEPEQAEAVLSDLLNVGVNTLLVSISPFHNAHIPYNRVMGVMDACRRVGMGIFPWVNAFVRDLTRLDVHRTHTMAEFEKRFGPDYLKKIPDRYWIHLGGRALRTFGAVFPAQPAEDILQHNPMSCSRALTDTSHFHIDLHGNYIPGLCAGLVVDMADLGNALPDGKYPLLEQLALNGIRGLVDLARRYFGYQYQRQGYLNHCDLCTEVRQYLRGMDGERFVELGPSGFYIE